MSVLRHTIALAFVAAAACGNDPVAKSPVDGGSSSADATTPRDGALRDATVRTSLVISPSGALTLTGITPEPVTFTAILSDGKPSTVPISWSIDPAELGSIDAATGVFTPTGAGGTVRVTAHAGTLTSTISIAVNPRVKGEGDPDFGKIPAGAGGVGGVGGEGGGSTISDPTLRAALDADATADATLSWLYPYDGTVWPRGLPAPLLQWRHGDHAPVAVKLEVSVDDDAYQATLYLGPPKNVTTIDRIPLPQAVWRAAQLSGKTMKVALSFVANEGGFKTYKASHPLSFTNAPTTLKGVVYYNSYGTKLAENYGGAIGGNGRFGGATLAIEGGSFDPKLIAGSTTSDRSGCRVCHTVSSDGSTLIALHNDGMQGSIYDLKTSTERVLGSADDGKYGWAALLPDGSAALGASGPPGVGGSNPASLATSAVYRTADGSTLTANGLSSVVQQATTPAFSPDGKKVAFNLFQGAGTPAVPGNGKSLFVMDVARPDANMLSFSNPVPMFTAAGAYQLPGWPFFLPDNSGVVFELELAPGRGNEHLMTRHGARGELWWTDLAGHAHALDAANGKGYLPTGANGHDEDSTLQYEPTVAPIVAGGYAWVVFTSRRLYGNVATRNPFESDPREFDLTAGNPSGPTTKKLWVTAISVPPKPGEDPSHPAFYLPAQELFAGNSRGFWSLNACKSDGASCEGGDECCAGYCGITTEFGGICGSAPPNTCAKEYDKCNVDADCCSGSGLSCIAGHCATQIFL